MYAGVPTSCPAAVRVGALGGSSIALAIPKSMMRGAGAPPFNGDSVTSVTRQRLVEDPPSLAERCDGIPEALESAVRTALAREAGDRFASAREFAEALLGAATGTGAVPRRREAGGPDEKSIAILPLVNRTRAAEDDYLSDGISEELIRLLSSVEGLRVVARSSSFSFKGKPGGARMIGQKLGVGAVLEGSLQRSGGRLRIRIQLVHVADGSDLWSERYDRAMEDIFTVEDDIAQSVAGALKVRLLPVAGSLAGSTDEVAPPPDTQGRVFRPPVSDVRAYECYLRARQEIFHFTEAALSRAVEYLNKGLAIGGDGNVFLLSALGYAYWQHINAGISTDPGYLDRAQACADRIFATAADSPHGHRLSGLVAMHRGQPDLAVVHLTRALGHDPNDTDALFWLTLLHGFRGHPRRAAPLVERLISIDPLTALHQMLPGFLALMEGEFERACEPFRNAHGMDPANPVLRLGSGQALAMAGRLDEACEVLSRLREEMPGVFFAQLGHFLELALRGEQQALALVDVELAAAAEPDLQYCWTLAQGFALVGAADEAIEWLRRALQAGFSNYPLLAGSDPLLRNLRGGDAFETLMQDVKRAWEKAGVTDA